ncbi:MAG: T9SS type A sorting domain-containing protein [Bacteroidia bacterium]|nr:T9SS type A sorting domain-containing protein [Bacteroidia bacterium]MBT8279404.1 T9SS type A sorting domain-containing protein [Bacteroidia bacterium]NND25066.1 T9SS type A sorting domain-containing protein [Flavobacteriaceae bacterium]NNK59380.1 T9SS type A sorting domain-containing protein [Flavobacteriaceae bacterium]NNL33812.1 T9SS type A sorting domain-containing protein [Flavobacteriaceae bacterium]
MKKKYFLFFVSVLLACNLFGQTTITHSNTETITPVNTVACPTEPTQYLRAFDLTNEFGISTDFEIIEVEFGVEVSETTAITMNLYTSDSVNPTTATLTNIYTAAVPVGIAEEGTVVSHVLTAPVTVPSTAIIVFELAEAVDGIVFRIGSNIDGQTAPSWLSSPTCGAGTVDSFGFTNHYVINVIGNEILGVDEFSLNTMSLYPNPTSDKITIDIHESAEVKSLELYSITGQLINANVPRGVLDMSNLNTGIYFLKMITAKGITTKRITKK